MENEDTKQGRLMLKIIADELSISIVSHDNQINYVLFPRLYGEKDGEGLQVAEGIKAQPTYEMCQTMCYAFMKWMENGNDHIKRHGK